MKSLMTAIFGVMLIAGSATAADKSALERVQGSFANISNLEIEHYHIEFQTSEAVTDLVQRAKSCQNAENFKASSGTAVGGQIREVLFKGLSLAADQGIMDTDDGWYSAHEVIEEETQDLASELNESKVSICKDVLRPAYSDWQEITIVKVNGKTAFGYLVGFPD